MPWMNYYGRFRRSELYPILTRINTYLMRVGATEIQATALVQSG